MNSHWERVQMPPMMRHGTSDISSEYMLPTPVDALPGAVLRPLDPDPSKIPNISGLARHPECEPSILVSSQWSMAGGLGNDGREVQQDGLRRPLRYGDASSCDSGSFGALPPPMSMTRSQSDMPASHYLGNHIAGLHGSHGCGPFESGGAEFTRYSMGYERPPSQAPGGPHLRTSFSDANLSHPITLKPHPDTAGERHSSKHPFRSFLGVLGLKKEPDFKAIKYRPRDIIPESDFSCTDSPVVLSDPTTHVSQTVGIVGDVLRQGRLLHLVHEKAWVPCHAVLTSASLFLNPLDDAAYSSTVVIQPSSWDISACLDVRSLSSKETSMLPPTPEELYVFTFMSGSDGGRDKSLAARSMAERGAWVSSVWDAILMSRKDARDLYPPADVLNDSPSLDTSQLTPRSNNVLRVVNASTCSLLSSVIPEAVHDEATDDRIIEKSLPRLPSFVPSGGNTIRDALQMLRSAQASPKASESDAREHSIVKERISEMEVRDKFAVSDSSAMMCSPRNNTLQPNFSPTSIRTKKVSALDLLNDPSLRGSRHGRSSEPQLQSSTARAEVSVDMGRHVSYSDAAPQKRTKSQGEALSRSTTQHTTLTDWSADSAVIGAIHFSTLNTSPTLKADIVQPKPLNMRQSEPPQVSAPSLANEAQAEQPLDLDRSVAIIDQLQNKFESLRRRDYHINNEQIDMESGFLEGKVDTLLSDFKAARLDAVHAKLDGIRDALKPSSLSEGLRSVHIGEDHVTLGNVQPAKRGVQLPNPAPMMNQECSNGTDKEQGFQSTGGIEELNSSLKKSLSTMIRRLDAVASDGTLLQPAVDLTPVLTKLEALTGILDMQGVQSKLDVITTAIRQYGSLETREPERSVASDQSTKDKVQLEDKVQQILDKLEGGDDQSKRLDKQQTESVKYLHELNTWLETVVTNGGNNSMQAVTGGIERLTKEWLDQGPELSTNNTGEGVPPHGGSLITQLKQFLASYPQDSKQLADIGSAVGALVQTSVENTHHDIRNSENDIRTMLEQQRIHYETLMKELAAQLSNEIRGEHIRFVDAMKEATAINVQQHVEEFKKSMTTEVTRMTQEVMHLQRERQTIEHQLSELFALLARQKQLVTVGQQSQLRAAVSAKQAPGGTRRKMSKNQNPS